MRDGFRVRMGLLHTWAGLVLSALLFAIFWTGTLSVFDKEIDRWMMPVTRIDRSAFMSALSVDRDVMPLLKERAKGASAWSIVLPNERVPYLTLAYDSEESPRPRRDRFHPATLEPLPASHTNGASGFIYPFHHNLTLRQNSIGAWLVGIASMGMLCLLVSGVAIHRKIFAEFFTLRLFRRFGRANLDVHNLTGIVLLPFIIVITLSGLVIAHLIYFPQAPELVFRNSAVKPVAEAQAKLAAGDAVRPRGERRLPRAEAPGGDANDEGGEATSQTTERVERGQSNTRREFLAEALGRVRPSKVGKAAGDIASIDQMIVNAERDWGPGSVYMVRVNHPGDAGGVAALRRSSEESVTRYADNKRFALATGESLKSFQASTTINAWNFIGGMHYIQFRHWALRWLYFLGGLGGCVVIASGLFHWTQARNKGGPHATSGVVMMNVLNIAAISGIIAATLAFLVTNRVLNDREQLLGVASRDLEVYVFFGTWLFCLLHASVRVLRQRPLGYLRAWREQCWMVAALSLAAVLLNWCTTGDHLAKTLVTDIYLPVAGVDLTLLVGLATSVWAAHNLGRRERGASAVMHDAFRKYPEAGPDLKHPIIAARRHD